MKDKALLLFQFGPVQGFIAQAETAQDLWAGSDLLSELTEAALKALPEEAEVVFPAKREGPGLPNRVLAFVPRETATETACAMADALRTALRSRAQAALRVNPNWEHGGAFFRQVEAFPQTSWAILEEPSGDMGQDYKAIGALLAARRNTRAFDAWPEEATKCPKDLLSGKEAALDLDHGRITERVTGFGAMNLIKRVHAEQAKFDDPVENKDGYVAVLMMDGDNMGKRLSDFKTEAEHQVFSELLLNFAPKAEARIKEYQGQPIYVGGDDVLAVLPAHLAVSCAKALAADFSETIGGTASAGVAIGHKSVPLQELVNRAREAEHRAKEVYGRNALALAIHKRSGEILWWGCKWASCGLGLFNAFAQCGKDVAGRFPYKLAALLQPYGLKGDLPPDLADIILAETAFAIEQTDRMKGTLNMAELATFLKEECRKHAEDFLGLFLSVAFLWRQGEDK